MKINYNKTEYWIADKESRSYHPETFSTVEEAVKVRDEKYTNRNKGDSYDDYWRNRPHIILKVTTEIINEN
jgi:hypothetical protein